MNSSEQVEAIAALMREQNAKNEIEHSVVSGREMAARAQFLDAIRNRARLNNLHYVVGEIRELADAMSKTAEEYISCGDSVSLTAGQTFHCNARQLNDLALRLLSEVDES